MNSEKELRMGLQTSRTCPGFVKELDSHFQNVYKPVSSLTEGISNIYCDAHLQLCCYCSVLLKYVKNKIILFAINKKLIELLLEVFSNVIKDVDKYYVRINAFYAFWVKNQFISKNIHFWHYVHKTLSSTFISRTRPESLSVDPRNTLYI